MTDKTRNDRPSSRAQQGCDPERVEHSDAYERLPVSIVVSDPNLPDNPLVYVNQAFTQMTGYTKAAACGRNCRFLQGEGTDPDTVARIRRAIDRGEPVTVNILNYTSAGKPFDNTLIIAPIEEDGEVAFFLGVQSGDFAQPSGEDIGPDMSERLSKVHERVHEEAKVLLGIIRDSLPSERTPEAVSGVLASRLDALAQLYGGVFRSDGSAASDTARLGAYLARVCSSTHLADRSYNVRMNTEFVDARAELRTAATVGLILSELLANAFDESNPFDQGGSIDVRFDWHDGVARLVVASHNGPASDDDSLLPDEDSVGGKIFSQLGRQIGITVTEDIRGGRVAVHFPTILQSDSALV